MVSLLGSLASEVLKNLPPQMRKKYEQLITDFVHQRDVTRLLQRQGITSTKEFGWLYHMRFYYYPKEPDVLKKLRI